MSRIAGFLIAGIIMLGFQAAWVRATEDAVPNPPDLTAGGVRDKTHDWLLGPTGLWGWIYTLKGRTTCARQILVTAVEKGSPADGILDSGDVILGVGGHPFDDDARIRFANAITAAETEKGGGVLRLIRWRAGQSTNVETPRPPAEPSASPRGQRKIKFPISKVTHSDPRSRYPHI